MALNVGTIEAVWRLRDEFSANFQRGVEGAQRASGRLRAVGATARGIGRNMSVGVGLPVAAAGAAFLKFGNDVNAGMANVATLIPGQVDRINELRASVLELGPTMGKSSADMTSGLFDVISALGDTSDTMEILRINTEAAVAGQASTSEAIALTTAVAKGYNETTAESFQLVADLAFKTNELGQTTFPELAASMGRVVPLASELKVSQQELFGVMATATGVTGGAAEVSTQLRGVLQALLAPTKDMSLLYEELGVSGGKALLEQQGLQGALETIVGAANAAGDPLTKYIGSVEGVGLALNLTGSSQQAFTEKLAAMEDVTGAAALAFEQQTAGVNEAGFALTKAREQAAAMMATIGVELTPILAELASMFQANVIPAIQSGVQWFSELDPGVKKIIVGVGAAAVVLGPLVAAFGALAAGIGLAMPVIAGIGTAIAGLAVGAAAPFVVVGLAIAAAIAAWVKWGDDITKKVRETVEAVEDWLIDTYKGSILESWVEMNEAAWELVEAIFSRVVEGAQELYEGVKKWLLDEFGFVVDGIKEAYGFIEIGFLFMKDAVVGIAEAMFNGIKTWLVDRFTGIVDGVREKIDAVTGFFRDMKEAVVGNSFVPEMVDLIGDHVKRLDTNFVDVISGQVSKIGGEGGFFAEMSGSVQGIMGALFGGGDVVGSLANFAINGLATLADALVPGLGQLVNLFSQYAGDIARVFGAAFGAIWDGFSSLVGGITSAIGGIPGFGGIRGNNPDTDLSSPFPGMPGQAGGDEGATAGLPGFANGTGGRFIDFGAGTPVMLHGRERVQTEREAGKNFGGSVSSQHDDEVHQEIAGLRQDMRDANDELADALFQAIRDGRQLAV